MENKINQFKEYCIGYCKSFPQSSATLMINNVELRTSGKKLYLTYKSETDELFVSIKEKLGGQNNPNTYNYRKVMEFRGLIDNLNSKLFFLERLVREFGVDKNLLLVKDIHALKGVASVSMFPELLGINIITKDLQVSKDIYKNSKTGVLRVANENGVPISLGEIDNNGVVEMISSILHEGYKASNMRDNINLSSYYLSSRKNIVYEEGRRLRFFTDYTPIMVKFSTLDNVFIEMYMEAIQNSRLLADMTLVSTTTLSGGKLQNLGTVIKDGKVVYTTRKRINQLFKLYPKDDSHYQMFLETLIGIFEPNWFPNKDRFVYAELIDGKVQTYSERVFEKKVKEGSIDLDNVDKINTLAVMVRERLGAGKGNLTVAEQNNVIEMLSSVELEDVLYEGHNNKYGYRE